MGVDFLTSSGVILGMGFTSSGQRQDFSTGGHFDQADEAPTLNAAYRGMPVWGDCR